MQRGRLIASGGGPGGPDTACFRCHGLDGGGQGASGFPLIGGMDARYLAKQLDDYASGARASDVMAPIARGLSAADRRAVALYHSRLAPRPQSPPRADPQLLQDGGVLYAVGSAARGIQACTNCHGPGARGMPPGYPRLAGQHAAYTEAQLRLWQAGSRRNDVADVMRHIASRLSQREIEAVAAYLAALGGRGPQ